MEVALGRLEAERVEPHLLTRSSQRNDAERLSLPAREQRRPVGPRGDADVDRDRPDLLGAAAVRALLLERDPLADQGLLELVESPLRRRPILGVGRRLGVTPVLDDDLLLHRLGCLLALELVLHLGGGFERGAVRGLDLLVELRIDLGHLDGRLLLARLLGQLTLGCTQLLDCVVGDVEGIEDLRLGDLVRARLDHQDRFLGAGHDQVEVGLVGQHLLVGVDDEVPVDLADPHGTHWRRERDVRHHQRGGSAVHREHVVGVDMVNRHRQRDQLCLVPPALREQRPDRSVDQARRERRLLPGATLALEERAGNLPGSVHALLNINGEGQKVHVAEVPRGGGTKDHRVARADDHCAGGLFGQLAGLE